MSTQLYPEVLDASTLIAVPTDPIYLLVGAEGQMDTAGTGTVGTLYQINTISDAATLFGPASGLTAIVSEVIKRGSSPVIAAASKKSTTPLIADRQLVWDNLSSDPNVRIRITDSVVQSDLALLATSCTQAELAQHKQFCVVGLAPGTAKAAYLAAATAIGSKRAVLIAPGVYNENGVLVSGAVGAAAVAAEVSKNSDPSNDMDLTIVSLLTGIEKDTLGNPLFREKIVTGALSNDFEDLLQGGVSPLMPSDAPGGVQFTHLRTTYTTDRSYDALSTRIIYDQVFVDVKHYIMQMGYLHRPNNEATQDAIASGVEALLMQRQDWISPVLQPDGTMGFNVSCNPTPDHTQVIVGYQGQIIRGIQTIKVSANLTIPV